MRDFFRFVGVVRLSDGLLVWPGVASPILFWAERIPVKMILALRMPREVILMK